MNARQSVHSINRPVRLLPIVLVAVLLSSGCAAARDLVGMGAEEPTPTAAPQVVQVPTFTPTVEVAAPPPADTPVPPAEPAQPAEENDDSEAPAAETSAETPAEAEPAAEEPTAEPTPDNAPKFLVQQQLINVRTGPGTGYGLAGSANANQEFDIVAKSPDGTWWQICCVNGQQVWVFGQLGQATNAEAVAVAQNIPAPPPPPTPVPVPPTNTPEPVAQQPAAPPPAEGDPCVNIGGDGCKWKMREGPLTGDNGGGELRLMLLFVHGGRGDEEQGSYFVGLEKDGQRVNVSDAVRSQTKTRSSGPLGDFNYDYKVPAGELPGGTVAGNYTMWVIDGVGERDSRNITFGVPDGQGNLRIVWDQN